MLEIEGVKKFKVIIYPFECVDVSCFMFASEAALVAFTICSDVFLVLQTQLLDSLLDHFVASLIPHGFRAATLFEKPEF